jgi:hypothetical protein
VRDCVRAVALVNHVGARLHKCVSACVRACACVCVCGASSPLGPITSTVTAAPPCATRAPSALHANILKLRATCAGAAAAKSSAFA